MKSLKDLLEVADILLGPGGCPWDRKQTFFSLQPYFVEEVQELLEAIDAEDNEEIIEEAGDLFYAIIFLAKLGEKEQLFTLDDIINTVRKKLVRRHPHVFGELKINSIEELSYHWDEIKKKEKAEKRKSALDGIPKGLPLLAKAQKMLGRFKKKKCPLYPQVLQSNVEKEADFSERLYHLIAEADEVGIEVESAFRRYLSMKEKDYRVWEKK